MPGFVMIESEISTNLKLNIFVLSVGPSIIHHGRTWCWSPAPVHWDSQVLQFIHNHGKEECELIVAQLNLKCYKYLCIKCFLNCMNQSRLCFSPQCVLATYASILGVVLFFKLKPKKKAIAEKWSCELMSASLIKVLKSMSNFTSCHPCCVFAGVCFSSGTGGSD